MQPANWFIASGDHFFAVVSDIFDVEVDIKLLIETLVRKPECN